MNIFRPTPGLIPIFLPTFFFLLLAFPLSSCSQEPPAKPVIWVYTDMSDPRDQRIGGHPQNDPDDICSMASLLLSAYRYDIRGIVVASTNRQGLQDPMPFVNEVFVAAYQHDLAGLNKNRSTEFNNHYQESIPFQQSSLTIGGRAIKFDPENDYEDLSDLSTVRQLVDLANEEPVYVLSWGPLTESAMAIQHCLTTGNEAALNNIFVISHWTKSSVAQGSPEAPFEVANCKDDRAACDFMHEIALADDRVKFIELGCVGQKGIVNGTGKWAKTMCSPEEGAFANSHLGQIFVSSKFYHGKPDFSDASTHWLLAAEIAPGLDDYPHDGSLSLEQEEALVDSFFAAGHHILSDLSSRSIQVEAQERLSENFLAEYFTYIYFNHHRKEYGMHLPVATTVTITNEEEEVMLSDQFDRGSHKLDLSEWPEGTYEARVTNSERVWVLEK